MKYGKLDEITGDAVREAYADLFAEGIGCWAVCFATDSKHNYAVCIGWNDTGCGWKIAWKIGRQTINNVMQCDFDVDFEMPYDPETGDVDDTLGVIEPGIDGFNSETWEWDALAKRIREEASRVWEKWKEMEDE